MIKGIYLGPTKRNEKNGYSQFNVRIENRIVSLHGIIINYPKHAPVEIEEKDGEVISMRLSDDNSDDVIDFLMSKSFINTGASTVNKLLDKTGNQIFEYIRNEKELPKLTKTETEIVNVISYYIGLESVLEYMISEGMGYHETRYAYEYFGNDAEHVINAIKSNPYALIYAKVPFSTCESIAHKNGIESYNPIRVKALVFYILDSNHKQGNTYIPIEELYERAEKIEDKIGLYKTERLFILKELLSDDYYIETINEDFNVYLKNDYITEYNIAQRVSAMYKKDTAKADIDMIGNIAKTLNIVYSPEQIEAFNSLVGPGIKLITGGPGTGKTTLLKGMLLYIKQTNPYASIRLCAPTGCAAKKMTDEAEIMATTIHKMLNIMPYNLEISRSNTILNADYVFIDESSMLDMYIFNILLSSIRTDTTVIMLGDVDQLPSIEAGNVYKDLIDSNIFPTYRLKTVFRQEESLIISNSHRIINGNTSLKQGEGFKIVTYNTENEIITGLKSVVDAYKSKNISDYKVYTSCKKTKFPLSTTNLNKVLRNDIAKSIDYGFCTFGINDKVIFTVNNYAKGYFNGQEGVITHIQSINGTHHLTIRTEDGEIIINGSELDDIDLCYSMTAHKSQGGECENAIIIVPKEPVSLLKRQLLYVEVTRAKKNVIIFSQKDALNVAISNYGEIERKTNLINKIEKLSKI